MRKRALAFVLLASCGTPAAPATTHTAATPGEIIGRIELAPDVPASGCQVLLEGTPLGAPCGPESDFDLRHVPPGRWDLRVILAGAGADSASSLPVRRVAAAANPGFVTDTGAIQVARPGSIGGRVAG